MNDSQIQRRIVREIHKHRDFFQERWKRFCRSANETARQCHRYDDEQNGPYVRWQQDVLVPQMTQIIEARNAAVRRGERELVVSSDKKLQAAEDMGTQARNEHLAVCEKRFAEQGWIRWDRGSTGYAFFGLPGGAFWVPSDFVNPVAVALGFEQASDEIRLLCDCALLAVLHDFTVKESEPHICCGPQEADGEAWYFEPGDPLDRERRTGFVWEIHDRLEDMKAKGEIDRAWGRVKAGSGLTSKDQLCPHTPDFRTVSWFGTKHAFTSYQAACVKVWYQHWRAPVCDVSDETVLEAAECVSKRVSDLFKRNPAWKDMIVEGDTRGTHRLREPTEPKPRERKRKRPSKR